jgi:hypothetical protein
MDIIKDEIQGAETVAYRTSKMRVYKNVLDDLSETLDGWRIGITDEEKSSILSKVKTFLDYGNDDGAASVFSDFLWEDVWANIDERDVSEMAIKLDREYNAIEEHKYELEEAYYGRGRYTEQKKPNLDDMLTQFHIGLHIAHHNGVMAEHLLAEDPDYSMAGILLKDLSVGKYVPRWDRDLERLIGKRYDPEEEDSQFIDWQERGRTRNPGAIPAPADHIFIGE